MGVLGAFMIAGSALALTAAPATAACNPTDNSNTCLEITSKGDGLYDVYVGIDIYMSRQEAEFIINAGGELFVVVLMAHDHDDCSDDTSGLTELSITDGWLKAGDGGLSVEVNKTVGSSLLNEDRDDRDELCARGILHDAVRGREFIFHSGVVVGYYCPQHWLVAGRGPTTNWACRPVSPRRHNPSRAMAFMGLLRSVVMLSSWRVSTGLQPAGCAWSGAKGRSRPLELSVHCPINARILLANSKVLKWVCLAFRTP